MELENLNKKKIIFIIIAVILVIFIAVMFSTLNK
jgi:flagellar basal body-associated protein FliL